MLQIRRFRYNKSNIQIDCIIKKSIFEKKKEDKYIVISLLPDARFDSYDYLIYLKNSMNKSLLL